MKNLKKNLKLKGDEFSDSLQLSHLEFQKMYNKGKVDYQMPKRYLPIFYRLNIDKWRQLIYQFILLVFWCGIILGIYLLFRKEWFLAIISIVGGWTFNQWGKVFAIKSIRKGIGKLRGRKYKSTAGMLLVIGNEEKLKITAFDVQKVNKLGINDLANGGVGRLTVYTEEAIKELGAKFK